MKKNGLTLAKWAFAAYCLLMLWLLFGQRIGTGIYGEPWKNINTKVLSTIKWYIYTLREVEDPVHRKQAVINLVGNVVMFVPAGFFLPLLFESSRNFFVFLLYSLGIILAIELTQLVAALGCCDVDDLVLNLPGMVLGYLFWAAFFRKKMVKNPS